MRAEFMHRIALIYIRIEFTSRDQPVNFGSLLGNFIFQLFNFGKFAFNIAGLHTFFCRPRTSFASGWLGYFINSNQYHRQLLPYITGIKVASISRNSIQETLFVIPLIEEQKNIAEALSNVDALIAALDKKIAKKRLIKQGAMQQLLTGKKRLPNFSEKWVSKKLGRNISHKNR